MKYAQIARSGQEGARGRSGSVNPGLWILPLAAAAAAALVPHDTSELGSLMLSGWILAAGIIATIVLDMTIRGFQRVFRAEHLLLLGIVVIVIPELLQPFYASSLEPEVAQRTFYAIGLFCVTVAAGSSLAVPKLPRSMMELADREYSADSLFKIMWACWILAMLNFAVASNFSLSAMISGLGTNRWAAPWPRGAMGGWDAFRDFLGYFGHLVPVFTILLVLKMKAWTHAKVIIGIVCSIIVVAFLGQEGGRRILLVIVGSSILTWAFVKRRSLRPSHLALILAVMALTGLIAEWILKYRNQGYAAAQESNEEVEVKGIHVDENFNSLGETLQAIPAEADFVGFQYIVYVLVRPIPRVFWPGKPTSSGFDLAEYTNRKGLTISISEVGEWYMSFGWTGIVVGGFLMGWIAKLWSQLIDEEHSIAGSAYYAVGTMAIFLGMRSLLELVLMTYPVICWYGLDRILWKWTNRKKGTKAERMALAGPAV